MVNGEITDADLKLARQGAVSAYRSGRGVMTEDDLVGEAHLWVVEHLEKVTRWRGEGTHGRNKLRYAVRCYCLGLVFKARKQYSGLEKGDVYWYTKSMLQEIIPDIFNRADWAGGSSALSNDIRSAAAPAEGNNRLAIILDVHSAFVTLPKESQLLLRNLYEGSGMHYELLAIEMDLSERTVRRREDRALERMVERLGGEPPWV